MKRSLLLASVLTAGFALPVLAADVAVNSFTEDQARQHLLHLGYTNISDLQKDQTGKWVGTAQKDGKTVPVAVNAKPSSTSAN